VFNQLDEEIKDNIFLIKSTGNGGKALNDYKALRNTSLTPPSEVPKKTDATKAPTRLKAKIASPTADRPNPIG
jgi:hypothetical protein